MADKFVNETGVATIRDWVNGKFALETDFQALSDKVDDIVAEGGEPNVIETVKVAGTALTPDAQKAVDIPAATTSAAGVMSATDKTKLDGVEAGAEENVIESVKRNGVALTPDANKAVDIYVPEVAKSGAGETEKVGISKGEETYYVPTYDAMEDYVSEHGGVIQKVKRNGVELAIDSTDKSVDILVPDSVATTSADGLMSSTDKTKLDGVETGAEANVIESVKVNGTALTPDANKAVDVNVAITSAVFENTSASFTNKHTDNFVISGGGSTLEDTTVDFTGADGFDPTIHSVPTVGHMQAYVAANGGKIDVIKVNGTAQTITNKEVDLTVPTDLSDLTNTGADPYAQMSDVESALVGALKPKGSIAFASLPALTAANLNNMYNVSDSFTTTADFIEGAGINYPAGTNVAIINTGSDASPIYKYDTYVGQTDLSAYWTSATGANNSLNAMTVAEIQAILNPVTP